MRQRVQLCIYEGSQLGSGEHGRDGDTLAQAGASGLACRCSLHATQAGTCDVCESNW